MRPITLLFATAGIGLVFASSPASAQRSNLPQAILNDLLGQLLGVQNSTDPNVGRCESVVGRTQTCRLPENTRAEFVRQVSRANCTLGSTMIIQTGSVTVSNGCSAEFRVIPLANNATSTPAAFEAALVEELRRTVQRPQGEFGSLFDLRVVNSVQGQSRIASERIYTGLAQANWGGRVYPLDFSARIDANTGRFMNLDYRYQNPNANTTGATTPTVAWQSGTAMDAQARDALASALEAEHRRRAGVRTAQVVINTTYREQMLTRSDYRFTGRYGVSINDGDWQTFTYDGRVFLPRNTVSELTTTP